MQYLSIEINNLRGIDKLKITLPYSDGLFAITGENGIGKTTLFLAAAQLVYPQSLNKFFNKSYDKGATVKFDLNGNTTKYTRGDRYWTSNKSESVSLKGHFEGSLVFGSRFLDMQRHKISREHNIIEAVLIPADDFIISNLGIILKKD